MLASVGFTGSGGMRDGVIIDVDDENRRQPTDQLTVCVCIVIDPSGRNADAEVLDFHLRTYDACTHGTVI